MSVDKPDEKQWVLDNPAATVETHSIKEHQTGDAALANAPWQYKLIALVTALCFPSKDLNMTMKKRH